MQVAVSSGCFATDKLDEIITSCRSIGVKVLELGANVRHTGKIELLQDLKCQVDIDFLIHHYFPAPQIPFVCNIAHPDTKGISCSFIKKTIEMCGTLGIPYYSIHAGYAINPSPYQLGRNQTELLPIPYEDSLRLFVETAMSLERYAKKYGVRLLWENNVVNCMNRFDTPRTPFLFSDIEFLKELENDDWWKNALILLDIGHLKVSAMTLGFSIEEFVERIAERVVQVHLSDNDGLLDTNKPVTNVTLDRFSQFKTLINIETLILEVYKIPLSMIRSQVEIIENIV
jgi:sugar phosphate isomerase/epimerase